MQTMSPVRACVITGLSILALHAVAMAQSAPTVGPRPKDPPAPAAPAPAKPAVTAPTTAPSAATPGAATPPAPSASS
ncbi:MAG: hypothetical protein K2X32_00705, partial [Phycisphaerales bacterium]|nr:hypothetical protein [Phycisphaerales bacterium]